MCDNMKWHDHDRNEHIRERQWNNEKVLHSSQRSKGENGENNKNIAADAQDHNTGENQCHGYGFH